MAHPSSSPDSKILGQLVTAAYRCASDGDSIDAVLCSDEKRAAFDFFFLALADYLEITITPEDGRRTLLGLRAAGLVSSLGPSSL